MTANVRFHLNVWGERPIGKIRLPYVTPAPRGRGGWIAHFQDGRESIDFGVRREAEACARYFGAEVLQ